MSKRPMIIGAESGIGRAISAEFRLRGIPVLGTSRRRQSCTRSDLHYLDLSNPNSIGQLDISQASSIIFCAGINGSRQCEIEPARSRKVNVTGLNLLNRKCSMASIPITLISSSAVFSDDCPNRSEDAPVSPTSAYGEQKSDQEKIVLSERSGRVIRLTKVLPDTAGLLVSWARTLRGGRCIDAFLDYYVSPLSYHTVATFIVDDTLKEEAGVRHLSPDGQLSYYELANTICEFLGASGEVRPLLNAAPRTQRVHTLPKNTVLSCDAELSRQVSMHAEIQIIFRDLVSTPRLGP